MPRVVAVFAVGAILVAAACSAGSGSPPADGTPTIEGPGRWPVEAEQAYLDAEIASGALSPSMALCMLEHVSAELSYEEFVDLERDLSAGVKNPDTYVWDLAFSSCLRDRFSEGVS